MTELDFEFLAEIQSKATLTTCAFSEDAAEAKKFINMLGLDLPLEELRFHDHVTGYYPKGK